MNRYALIGAAGFVAPRHLKAIRETGHRLLTALDPHDSVGVLDSHFPDARFFKDFELFENYLEDLRHEVPDEAVSHVVVCSPNHLHEAHIRCALRHHAHAVCEKPLVLDEASLERLERMEARSERRIFTILQLRLHPVLLALREKLAALPQAPCHEVDLTVITSRGPWYATSWKGDVRKSGRLVMNIGIHLFDMIQWLFGEVRESVVHLRSDTRAAGWLELPRARVRWFLSLEESDLPATVRQTGGRTYRRMSIGGEEVDFTDGFTDLHTKSHEEIAAGRGFGLRDARLGLQAVWAIQQASPIGKRGDFHPFLREILP